MLHKFNISALNDYSQQFAQQVCNDFYADNQAASGEQILNLTSVPQVNMFVISSLYEKWKADAVAFRSPYFDFEKEEVKEALTQFMNVVSRNIAVKRTDLEPLLTDATKNTLILLLDPSGYFNEIFRNQPNFTVTQEAYQSIQKYVRLNRNVVETVGTQMGDRAFVFANQAIEWADKEVEQNANQLEDVEQWANKFSEKLPLDIQSLLKKPLKSEPIKVIEPVENQSFFDKISPSNDTAPKVVQPIVEDKAAEPVLVEEPATSSHIIEERKIAETVNSANSNGVKESLNDSLRNDQATVYGNYQKQPIASISQNISLAQKFMFIHQLFSGSNSAYEAAITELENAPDFIAAREMITYKLASQYMWDMTSDTVGDLLDIVKRRFGQ